MSGLYNLFAELAKLTTEECFAHSLQKLSEFGYKIETDKQNWIAATPIVDSPIALLAHCDTVGKAPPTQLLNRSGVVSVKHGGILGADDRAGVAAIFQVLANGYRPQVYLTTGEESGGLGAMELADTDYAPPDDLRVLIQIDRQGGNDFVTYDCESNKLDKWVSKFGFIKAVGSFSDISVLAPHWGIAAANVGCGYYGQHTGSEYLILPQLQHTVSRLQRMIDKPPKRVLRYVDAYAKFSRRNTYSDLSNFADCLCEDCHEFVHWTEYDAAQGICDTCAQSARRF